MKLLNKVFAYVLAGAVSVAPLTALAADDISVYVDGELLSFDVPPVIENDRTLVPMRAIFEALGANVEWDGETETVTAVRGADTLKITIGSNNLYKNDTVVELDVPAKITDGRTLVPVRAISESFSANVEWDSETRSVKITRSDTIHAAAGTAENGAFPFDALSDADMEELKSKIELIRYDYEQNYLPQYALGNKDMYADLEVKTKDDAVRLAKQLTDVWTRLGTKYIIELQINSDTVYEIGTGDAEDKEAALIGGYEKILKEAEMDADTMFEGVMPFETKSGTRLAVIVFKSADTLVQCKYIGIAASKNGKTRYFTAENDMMQPEIWFFCEVAEDGRGTLSSFAKQNEVSDISAFANGCVRIYENNSSAVAVQPDVF